MKWDLVKHRDNFAFLPLAFAGLDILKFHKLDSLTLACTPIQIQHVKLFAGFS
jgi:hypothetical protein